MVTTATKTTTPIKRAPSATLEQAVTWVKNTQPQRESDVLTYAAELWRLCTAVGYDPVVLFAQAAYETGVPGKGPFESELWKNDLNPAGIGATDAGKQDYRPFHDGVDAARVHTVHMGGYIEGPAQGWLEYTIYKYLDPRWVALLESRMMGTVRTVEDLGSGKWATQASSLYATAILKLMAEIQGAAQPVPPDEGTEEDPTIPDIIKATMPPVIWVGSPNYHARGMDPIAIIYHCTDDLNLQNTLSWFLNPNSNASSTLVIDRDGKTYQCVSSKNVPWTNGVVRSPNLNIGYVQEMRRRGVNFNNGSITIETVATPSVPPTEAQYKTLEAWTKYFTHPDVYGKSIKKIRGFLGRHADIDSEGRSYCPGPDFNLSRIIRSVNGDPLKLA
jgi:hypothetical protein